MHERATYQCEIRVADDGRVWINVDGVCALRVTLAPGATLDLHDGRYSQPEARLYEKELETP